VVVEHDAGKDRRIARRLLLRQQRECDEQWGKKHRDLLNLVRI
jgi:hypothetical protein